MIHADISPRNFLVADDLSIKLCDFAGSAIGDLQPLVEEEDRYRISPWSPRTFKTDLFALGCLIYEISTGIRPYDEIEDTEEVGKLYNAQIFPKLDGLKYEKIIYKCWTSQYISVDVLRGDYNHCIKQANDGGKPAAPWQCIKSSLFETKPSITTVLGIIGVGFVWVWVSRKRNWWWGWCPGSFSKCAHLKYMSLECLPPRPFRNDRQANNNRITKLKFHLYIAPWTA